MKNFLVCLCLIAALLAMWAPCSAQPANGVIAQERIVQLPQDQGKWFVSVVGNPQDARFSEIASWFDSGSLLALRNSVHFNVIGSDTVIFTERYAETTPELPMIRVQNAKGVVYSQICGRDIPMSAQSLNAQIAQDVATGPKANCPLRPLLPWRRNHSNPEPKPEPQPLPDPTPGPINTPDKPVIDDAPATPPVWPMILICGSGFLVGAVTGTVITFKQWTRKRKPARK